MKAGAKIGGQLPQGTKCRGAVSISVGLLGLRDQQNWSPSRIHQFMFLEDMQVRYHVGKSEEQREFGGRGILLVYWARAGESLRSIRGM